MSCQRSHTFMEPIKIEFVFPESFIKEITDIVRVTVEKTLRENIQAVKAEQTSLTRQQAAQRLHIGLTSLHKLIKEESIKTVKAGRRTLIPESEIENFLKQSA